MLISAGGEYQGLDVFDRSEMNCIANGPSCNILDDLLSDPTLG